MNCICKFNKMINCEMQTKCAKCTWNPTYFESLKQKNRKEMEGMRKLSRVKENPKKPRIYTDDETAVCTCPECGQTLYADQKYCDECGQKLDWHNA